MNAYTIEEKNLERQRLLAALLKGRTLHFLRNVALFENPRILDLGCGMGETSILLSERFPNADLVGVDQDLQLLEIARRKDFSQAHSAHFQIGDAERLDFADGTFDLVFTRFLLIHLPDPLKALKEMRRVCKKGGVVFVHEPDMLCLASYRARNGFVVSARMFGFGNVDRVSAHSESDSANFVLRLHVRDILKRGMSRNLIDHFPLDNLIAERVDLAPLF